MTQTRILIVEDEIIVARNIQKRLQSLGYIISAITSSGEKAVQKAAETRPDLVLMDIKLKGKMDGVEAARQIRTRLDIPTVYLTAHADGSTLQRAKITEPFGYILKPFESTTLHTTIEMALYKHRMEKKLKESERWLTTTLNSIGEAVIATDKEERIVFMNPLAEALTGWLQAEALGKSLNEVFLTTKAFHVTSKDIRQGQEPTTKALQESIVAGLGSHVVLIARDGTETPIDHNTAPIRDDQGNITGVVLIFQDITERKQAEQEREKLILELQDTLDNVKTLQGLLPICSSCKRIRDDRGYWTQVEFYIEEHTGAEFSHGLCPNCAKNLYPDLYEEST
jgi:PAS domain S-box-containing protein